ncbi:MAG: ABC transporter permease [Microthrixaceae bacterium]
MFRYALKSLRANATRLIATALAVIVGIGFLGAGLMLTDAMRDGLTGTAEQQYAGVDLALSTGVGGQDMGFTQVLPVSVAETASNTEGVEAAAGTVSGNVRVQRPDGTSANLRTMGRSWIDDHQLNPLQIVEGDAPIDDDDVVLDVDLAADADASVGDTVEIETPLGPVDFQLVGLSRFGDSDAMDDGGTASFTTDRALGMLAGDAGYQAVLIRTGGDADQVAQVADRLRTELPGTVLIQTRAEYIESATETAAAFLDFLRPVLQGFAYLALFVAAFVIFNTFSVVVTQRFRELALIRAVGGTPAQVRRSLIIEGFGIGVIASAMGVVAGGLFALLVQWVLGLFDVVLPGSGVKVTLGTVLVCMIAGTVVTVLSVIVPAFRAGRTKPVEAMRSSAVDTSGTSKVRAVFGAAFLALGALFLTINQLSNPQWYLIAPGALFLFFGTFVGGPLLARAFAIVMRPLLAAFGLTGRLAADNSVRNPRRTATTANALVIGLFLVTLVTVSGEAMKTSIVTELNKLSSSDYIVASTAAIPEALVADVDEVDGVSASAPVRSSAVVDLDTGEEYFVSTADLDTLETTAGIRIGGGDAAAVTEGEGIAIADVTAIFGSGGSGSPTPEGQAGERLGDVVRVNAVDGSEMQLTVSATLDGELDTLMLGSYVSPATFERALGDQPVNMIFVRVDPGEATEVGRRLEKVLDDYTGVDVIPGNFFGQIFATVFDFLIGAVNGLLGMSVVVALVGIVNTMTLSIFERRRELGMVRALGMTRQQVGRMVRIEAVLIGLLGTIIGMAAGILLSWVIISSLSESLGGGIDLAFNWARVGMIFGVGVLVGVLASLLPARRATRLDMLDAMNSA